MDLTDSIMPKSDQMNADDLLTGPRTFTIASIRETGSEQQPVAVTLAEFPQGRPYKPNLSMMRVMVAVWGKETDNYIGHRLTLFRDEDVVFGGQAVGGIRISHVSHIKERRSLALTTKRGRRDPYVVLPLPDDAVTDNELLTDQTRKHLFALFGELGINDAEQQRTGMERVLGRSVESRTSLSETEAQALIVSLTERRDAIAGAPAPDED
jgi:hypothetical protein